MLDPESETLKGMLVDAEICSEEQLIEIEEEHERTGKLFQELLVSYEIIGEDELMEIALEAGADDMGTEGDLFEITTDPQVFAAVNHSQFP